MHKRVRRLRVLGAFRLLPLCAALSLSCTRAAYFNNTTTLGGTVPGGRSNINVQFNNKTPFRAIFTFGTYDPQNPNFQPQFRQFFVDADASNRLEGNSISGVFTFTCGRALSVGGDRLVQVIREEELDGTANQEALQPGIAFSDKPLDDPDAGQPTAGRAVGTVTLQGAEYKCDSLLVYTFELDEAAPGGFRIDLNVVLP